MTLTEPKALGDNGNVQERAHFEDAQERFVRTVRDSSPTGGRSPGRPHKGWSDLYSGNNRLIAYLKENKNWINVFIV